MAKYSAVVRDKQTGKLLILRSKEYNSKREFISDIRFNGYSVQAMKVHEDEVFNYIMQNTNCTPEDWKEEGRWWKTRETGNAEYPKYHLTHCNGSSDYTVMILSWDLENGKANGWFAMISFPTIRECLDYMKYSFFGI